MSDDLLFIDEDDDEIEEQETEYDEEDYWN